MHVNHWPWSETVIFTQNITWCWIYSTTLNIIKMFHSHIKMYNSSHLEICISLYKVLWHWYNCVYVYIPYLYFIYLWFCLYYFVLYFPFTFCTNNMALYIMVLYAIVYCGTTRYMQSSILFLPLFLSYNVPLCHINSMLQYCCIIIYWYNAYFLWVLIFLFDYEFITCALCRCHILAQK